MSSQTVDLVVVIIANAVNLILAVLFLARTKDAQRVERGLGLAVVAMAVPLSIGVGLNVASAREWWAIILPLPMILHYVVELLFDYVLNFEFRYTRWLYPYLAVFYTAQMGLIGYSFAVSDAYGFVTLATYFLSLSATWYSYSKVRHGRIAA